MKLRAPAWLIRPFTSYRPNASEVAQSPSRNWMLYTMTLGGWLAGVSFFSVSTILPVFAYRLTGSPLIVGLIPALWDAGFFLPSVVIAPYLERQARVKMLSARLGVIQRFFYLALALAVVWLAALPRATAVWFFLLIMLALSLSNGLPATVGTELIARLVPRSQRGRFIGSALLLGQLLGVVGAQVAAFLLARIAYPSSFATVFLAGALCLWLSLIPTLFYIEPHYTPTTATPSHTSYVRHLIAILKFNVNFRVFLISRGLTYLGGMAFGFIAVRAVERFHLSDAAAAVFTGILYGASIVGFGVWGLVGDRWGYKRVLIASAPLWLVTLLMTLLIPQAWVAYVAFALMGLASAGGVMADITLPMEFGPESERPTYIGLARTATAPALLIAPIAGGWIFQTWGYPAMVTISLGFAVTGLVILLWRVVEPRFISQSAIGANVV